VQKEVRLRLCEKNVAVAREDRVPIVGERKTSCGEKALELVNRLPSDAGDSEDVGASDASERGRIAQAIGCKACAKVAWKRNLVRRSM
jgi:hypothetical protein